MELPIQPGTSRRAGKPWAAGRGSPFIFRAIRVCSSIALSTGMPRENTGRSSPWLPRYTAFSVSPAACSTSRRRTPVHSLQATAPRIHWVPPTAGAKRLRPLPAHSTTSLRVTCGRRTRSS